MGSQIGNGASVSVWHDQWLFDDDGKGPTTPLIPGTNHLKVCDLIDFTSISWRRNWIESNFNLRDQKLILSIPLRERLPPDKQIWFFTETGLFSAKSAYLLDAPLNLKVFDESWPLLWKTQTIPKVRLFWWRACNETLPTKVQLTKRHILESDLCARCNSASESFVHAIFGCSKSSGVWSTHRTAAGMALTATIPSAIFTAWKNGLDEKEFHWSLTAAWEVWRARNDLIFNNKQTPFEVITQRATRVMEDLKNSADTTVLDSGKRDDPGKWRKPSHGYVKINVDASLSPEGWVGLAVVIRDETRVVQVAAVRRNKAWWPPKVAEAKAALYGLRIARLSGIPK